MSEKDKGNLLAIAEACHKIHKFMGDILDADAFYSDDKTFDAVLMNFVVIGEAVVRLSNNLKERESHIPWVRIKGFRNIAAHEYFGVDAEEVWQIIKNHLPQLEQDILSMLKAS